MKKKIEAITKFPVVVNLKVNEDILFEAEGNHWRVGKVTKIQKIKNSIPKFEITYDAFQASQKKITLADNQKLLRMRDYFPPLTADSKGIAICFDVDSSSDYRYMIKAQFIKKIGNKIKIADYQESPAVHHITESCYFIEDDYIHEMFKNG